jgi:hypothetical protein
MFQKLQAWLRGVFAPRPVTINNYFAISSDRDPSRVAREVADQIAETRRFPTQSRHVKRSS